MIASRRASARLARVVIATSIAAIGVACTDVPRTNPVDAMSQLALTLTGPDSATAIGDTVAFHVRTANGESVDQLALFTVPSFLTPTTDRSRFVVTGIQSSTRGTGFVTARVGASEVSMPFVFSQQPVGASASDCFGHNVLSFDALGLAAYPTTYAEPICAMLVDRRGSRIPGASTGAWVSRDQRVAQLLTSGQQAEVNAAAEGSTYVVYTAAAFRDSVRVDVRQVLTHLTIDPPACEAGAVIALRPTETLQLSARAPAYDRNYNVITNGFTVQFALSTLGWAVDSDLKATVSQAGVLTAVSPSSGYVFGTVDRGGVRVRVNGCAIRVN